MATGVAKWIWENSRASNGSLIVLLAIADEIGEGEFTEMKIASLAAKARLSDKGARNAVKDLQALGELSVEARPGGAARYALHLGPVETTKPGLSSYDRPVKTTGRQKLPDPPEEPQVSGTPVKTTGPEISDMYLTGTGSSLAEVKDVPAKPPRRRSDDREDVDRLCALLADRIEANGCKRPNITDKWRDSARLMIDADGRTEDEIRGAINWSQNHEFWRANILSMPKLREKYDQLLMQAKRTPKPTANQNSNLDVVARFMQRARNGNS